MSRIKDIAAYTGFSPTTVSNVIHGRTGKMSPETKATIEAALEKFEYTSHMAGRLLAKNGSRIIGVLIQDSGEVSERKFDNPYLGEFLQAIEGAIREHGYFMMLQRISSIKEGKKLIEMWDLEGIVLSGAALSEVNEWEKESRVPIVFLDIYQHNHVLNVGIEDYEGSYAMTKHLAEMGHKKVAFFAYVGPDSWIGVDAMRAKGVSDFSRQNGLMYYPIGVPMASEEYELFIKNFAETYQNEITACFFSSDLLAARAMSLLYKLGYKVPEDFSIASFDGTLLSQFATPQITSVYQDVFLKAHNTIALLYKKLKNEKIDNNTWRMETKLIYGDSVKKIEAL